ncbi:lipocalin family protein [Ferruginibacter sp. SUN002]|uniref:lipocalin family protein n=1 Tax=Ferruginibacter sp. SUN002 TaxID=2937789 RepID=UPI003D3651F2
MKKSISILSIVSVLFILISCGDTTNNKLIIGSWQGAEWLVNGQPSDNNAKATSFTFNEKGDYTFNYGGVIEKGTYKVENAMLFTTPEKQQEIMVNITKLTNDSLVFDMNRGGQPETLTLLRKK